MLKRLFEHMLQLPDDMVRCATLQDIAMCAVRFDAFSGDKAALESVTPLGMTVKRWTTDRDHTSCAETEGRRTQWVMRDLIDCLGASGCEGLTWDELRFLWRAFKLSAICPDAGHFARVHSLVKPHLPAIEKTLTPMMPEPELPGLSKRLRVVLAEDIQSSRPREINRVAGMDLRCVGPVLTHKSHLTVLDNIPENCTVVVEEGSCRVEGFVMGRLVVRRHCDVRENISGTVIVREGDIRSRNIVDKAVVIAKIGAVRCFQAVNPFLVYAGMEITIGRDATRGRYMAPRIRVVNEARGGDFHVSRLVEAGKFTAPAQCPTRLILRRELTSLDYGEETDPEARRLMQQLRTERRRMAAQRTLLAQLGSDMERVATNTVYYLCTSGETQQLTERLQGAQRRLSMLNRLVEGLRTIVYEAEEAISGDSPAPGTPADPVFAHMDSEAGLETDLATAMDEFGRLRERLTTATRDLKLVSLVLGRARSQIDACMREIMSLSKEIAANERRLQEATAHIPMLAGPRPKSMVQFLRKLVGSIQDLPQDDPLARKLQAGFAKTMLRRVAHLIEYSRATRDAMQKANERMLDLNDQLQKGFSISMPLREPTEDELPRATGRFANGVFISPDPITPEENEDINANGILAVRGSEESTRTFMRDFSGSLVEVN